MITYLSEANTAAIRSSLALMKSKRGALEEAMSRYMSRAGAGDPTDAERARTVVIMDMLFDHAARITGAGEIVRIDRHRIRLRRLGIDWQHYSAFGDGLGAVMKDVLGAEAKPARLAAWGVAYWAIVRMAVAAPMALAA